MDKGDLRPGNFVLFPYEGCFVETPLNFLGDIAYAKINGNIEGADYSQLRPIFLDGWWINHLPDFNLELTGRVKSVSDLQNLHYFFNGRKELSVSKVPVKQGIVSGRNLEFNFD